MMDISQLSLSTVILGLCLLLILVIGLIVPLLNKKICQYKEHLILNNYLEKQKSIEEQNKKNSAIAMLQLNISSKKTTLFTDKENHYLERVSGNNSIYGIFRKRPEDVLEIKRPKHLPPISHKNRGISEASFLTALQRMKRYQKYQLYVSLVNMSENQSNKLIDIMDNTASHVLYRMNSCHTRHKKALSQPEIFFKSYHIYDERVKYGDYIKYEEVDKEVFSLN